MNAFQHISIADVADKQQDYVIADIRDVQKAINTVGDNLKIVETSADEMVFASAAENKTDPEYVAAYRHLSDLRETFEELVSKVSEIGKTETDIRETETKNDQLATRTSNLNMERVLSDLGKVKEENAQLAAKVKKLKG